MEQDAFDKWLRSAVRSYRQPPETNLDTLWSAIDAQRVDSGAGPARSAPRSGGRWTSPWLRMAAVLALGIGLGRLSAGTGGGAVVPTATPSVATGAGGEAPTNTPEVDHYLGQTVVLLSSLQADARGPMDTLLASRASQLLSTTRFLLDSPSSQQPAVRALLEDLELVLAQVVQMPSSRTATDVDLIHEALQQRDMMPRLRTAVANLHSAD